MERFLRQPLRDLGGIGPRRAADLGRAGLTTVEDLLYRLPRRYEDRRRLVAIGDLRAGSLASVAGRIERCGLRRTRRPGFSLFEATIRDASGVVRALWFNQRFLRDVFHAGQQLVLYGKVERAASGKLTLVGPQYEIVDDENACAGGTPGVHTGRLVPIYERIGSLSPKLQRRLMHDLVAALPSGAADPLPEDLRGRLGLPDLAGALREAHFPPDGIDVDELNRFRAPGQLRLILEELIWFQLGVLARRRAIDRLRKPWRVAIDDRVRDAARAMLPFRLTPGQKLALGEIVRDLTNDRPMNRLLQGDVGAGKTVVALVAALVCLENDRQVAIMAPTELLAEQHVQLARRLLAATRFVTEKLVGGMTVRERRRVQRGLASGEVQLVVGTHALAEEPVAFARLGLVVIDEQHRFGVLQRGRLRAKTEHADVLVMTATPIPRTLALTVFGDLDVSRIEGRPPGRRPVRTMVEPDGRRDAVYALLRRQLDLGRQGYVVYPLVEESEKVDLRAATQMADHLATEVLPAYRVALLHGRQPVEARHRVMTAFTRGDIDVLVCTSVVEVGVDVPNATVMIVEHAERFGLAQLHQLRGRVGRGQAKGSCILLYTPPLTDIARQRLTAVAETTDGFALADRDLELRGPGELYGTRQAGLPRFRVADLARDHDVMLRARTEAEAWLDRATDPEALVDRVRATWLERFGLVDVA